MPPHATQYFLLCLSTYFFLFSSVQGVEPIEIIDKKDRAIQAEIISASNDSVEIRRGNRRFTLKLDTLSKESQEKILQFAKQEGLFNPFPPFEADIIVRTKSKLQDGSSYQTDHTILPEINLTGDRKMNPLPAMEVTMFIICQNTKAKYVGNDRTYQIKGKQTIDIPAVNNGEKRTFTFKTIKTTYDDDRDRSNIGGWRYKYYACFIRDPKSKAIVTFLTNYKALETQLQKNKDNIRGFLEKSIGSPIPANY